MSREGKKKAKAQALALYSYRLSESTLESIVKKRGTMGTETKS